MGRNRGGYTIIEVMVVIAITAALFLSSIRLINGQQGDTQFSQVMQDLSSKMQSYVGQIKASSYPGMENYYCTIPAGQSRPQLVAGSSSSNLYNCVVLGRAFQVQPGTANSNVIHSYIVMGTRNVYSGTSDTGQLATSVDQANPEPAGTINSGTFSYVLIDDYKLGGGARILSSKSSGVEHHLVGIYNQLEGSVDSGGGNTVLSMRAYPYIGYPDQAVPQLRNCIEEQAAVVPPCPAASIPAINQWKLCISNGGSITAELEVNSSASGITTKYSVKACT